MRVSLVSFIVVRVSFVSFIFCLCDIDNLLEFGKAYEELYGRDQDLRTPTSIRGNLERGEEREALRGESDGSQPQNYASKLSCNRCTSTHHRTVQQLPPRLLPKIISKKTSATSTSSSSARRQKNYDVEHGKTCSRLYIWQDRRQVSASSGRQIHSQARGHA